MIALALEIAALILAAIDEAGAHGRSLLGWAVILICLALLWGRIG